MINITNAVIQEIPMASAENSENGLSKETLFADYIAQDNVAQNYLAQDNAESQGSKHQETQSHHASSASMAVEKEMLNSFNSSTTTVELGLGNMSHSKFTELQLNIYQDNLSIDVQAKQMKVKGIEDKGKEDIDPKSQLNHILANQSIGQNLKESFKNTSIALSFNDDNITSISEFNGEDIARLLSLETGSQLTNNSHLLDPALAQNLDNFNDEDIARVIDLSQVADITIKSGNKQIDVVFLGAYATGKIGVNGGFEQFAFPTTIEPTQVAVNSQSEGRKSATATSTHYAENTTKSLSRFNFADKNVNGHQLIERNIINQLPLSNAMRTKLSQFVRELPDPVYFLITASQDKVKVSLRNYFAKPEHSEKSLKNLLASFVNADEKNQPAVDISINGQSFKQSRSE